MNAYAMQCELVLGCCRCHLIASPSWERGRQTDASRQPCSYRAVLQIIRWGHGTCPVSLHPIACYSLLSLGRSTKAKGLGVRCALGVRLSKQWVGRVDIGDGLSFLTLCHLINNRLKKDTNRKWASNCFQRKGERRKWTDVLHIFSPLLFKWESQHKPCGACLNLKSADLTTTAEEQSGLNSSSEVPPQINPGGG